VSTREGATAAAASPPPLASAGSPANGAAVAPRTARAWWPALGRLLFRCRDLLFPLVLLPLLAFTRPRLLFGSARGDVLLDVLGVLLVLAGQLLRASTIGLAYIRRGGLDRRPAADGLVRAGLFAHSRNPLYLGNLLGIAGLAVVHGSPWALAIGVPFFALGYLAIVAAEEEFLHGRFGAAYDAYVHEVPRFLPRLRGLRATMRGMTFHWRRVARKEYGTTFAGASMLLLLLVVDRERLYGHDARRWWLALALWLPLVAGYSTLRWLKKSGRLGHVLD